MLLMQHRIFKLLLFTSFILNLTCPGVESDANFSVQYDLLQKLIILSPLNLTLKNPGVCLPCGMSRVMNQLCYWWKKNRGTKA